MMREFRRKNEAFKAQSLTGIQILTKIGDARDTSSMARTQGPHFHALLPDDPSAAAVVRTPQPSHKGDRGMLRRHFASSGRAARRP